jgi:transposase-like protein
MQTGTFLKFAGQVEVDETFIGGKARNMHKERRQTNITGTGGAGKAVVLGFLERNGSDRKSQVKTIHIEGNKRAVLHPKVRENVENGSEVYSDALKSYAQLSPEFRHQFIDHAERYVDGQAHTNGLENFWSLLKRSIKGTYVSVEPFHLFRYLDEQVFRFNKRGLNDGERFMKVIASVSGRQITYSQLTGKTAVAERPS